MVFNSTFISVSRYRFAFIGLAALVIAAFVQMPTAQAQSASEKAAAAEVAKLLSAVSSGGSSVSKVSGAVRRHFAIGTWVNALLGKQKKKFSSSEMSQFRKLLPSYLAKLYVRQFGGGGLGKVEPSRIRTVRGDVLVTTRLPRGSGGTVPVVWRLRVIGGKYRVIDYSAGGVSNVVLKRSEFGSIVKQSGAGELNKFLASFINS